MFLNVSVFNQYLNISADATIELSEEEESEEEKEEREEKEFEVIKYQEFYQTSISFIDIKNLIQDNKIIFHHYIEIITPPPKLVS